MNRFVIEARERGRRVSCPLCGAPEGLACFGIKRERKANHQARNDKAAGRDERTPRHPLASPEDL